MCAFESKHLCQQHRLHYHGTLLQFFLQQSNVVIIMTFLQVTRACQLACATHKAYQCRVAVMQTDQGKASPTSAHETFHDTRNSSSLGGSPNVSPPPTKQDASEYRKKPWMQTTSGLLKLHRDSAQALAANMPSWLEAGGGEQLTEDLKNMIHSAVVKMHVDLKDELHEEDITIHGVLGQGAFGTVYHGALLVKIVPSLKSM